MQIITQELPVTPLNLRVVVADPGLHLHVLQIRRARTPLGQEIGRVADVGVDVVRRCAAVGPVLQVECWEEAADDGETGADEADGGLDVCPECCLVDCVGWVCGGDPEENDDAVDTGEADEGS